MKDRKELKLQQDNDFKYLPQKQQSELDFWIREIQRYIKWYEGEIPYLYEIPAPTDKLKIKRSNLKESAILTWFRNIPDKYPSKLYLPKDYFSGKRVLDIGCGPNPHARAFTNCKIYCLDELVEEYKEIGFPLDMYSSENDLVYVKGSAENIPFEDNFFDAVISVNAIDHVDDFHKVAKEISRVLRPKGVLRMEVHYHPPTSTEPWTLNDNTLIECYGHLGIKKIHERILSETEK